MRCWLVIEPWPGEDLRGPAFARATPRLTVHAAPEAAALRMAQLFGLEMGEAQGATQVGYHPLERCAVCEAGDDDVTQPPTRQVQILTPKGWAPSQPEGK